MSPVKPECAKCHKESCIYVPAKKAKLSKDTLRIVEDMILSMRIDISIALRCFTDEERECRIALIRNTLDQLTYTMHVEEV